MEYNHNRFLSVRFGQAAVAAVLVAESLSEPDAIRPTLPIYLRELFPAELVGVMVQGSAARPVGKSELGVGYKFYVANNNFEGNSQTDLRDGKAWGARGAGALPDAADRCRRFDVAADIYRGHVGLTDKRARQKTTSSVSKASSKSRSSCFRRE